MPPYRKLKQKEIDILISQNCNCDDWNLIEVTTGFSTTNISNSSFSGNIKLGVFEKSIEFPGGVRKNSGIYNSLIHNCSIGNNSLINNIENYIANYNIGENVIIENSELIAVDGKSSFGNGVKVDVLDETGGRQVPIYDNLSSQIAYILTFYRHRPELISKLEKMIAEYSESIFSDKGFIGNNSHILNCKHITNVNIGDNAVLNGVSRLNNGSVNSNSEARVIIGTQVIADNFIISSGSEVNDCTVLTNCFIGQGCILSKHYSAIHSLFFANCQGINGEACSIFAGPFTVTHHKSTLLIAGFFSFLNAGSGSNQSNHMYKLGPIHHGVIERGSKTTSDSYLLWPAKIGSFTLVMGRHYKNSDTSDMPFSYLIENKDESWLVPGINLRSVGTIRDAMKWPKRDKRKGENLLDSINFNLLSPYTIKKMISGQRILKNLKRLSGELTETYTWQTAFINKKSLLRGIDLYELAIIKFLGNSFISRINSCDNCKSFEELKNHFIPKNCKGKGEWIDLAGLIVPKSEIEILIKKTIKDNVNTLSLFDESLKKLDENYYEFEWVWAVELFEERYGININNITVNDLKKLIQSWIKSVETLDKMLYEDAKKEFALKSMTSSGIDGGSKTKRQDFKTVRGTFEQNAFVTEIINHIDKKTKLGNITIKKLEQINQTSFAN